MEPYVDKLLQRALVLRRKLVPRSLAVCTHVRATNGVKGVRQRALQVCCHRTAKEGAEGLMDCWGNGRIQIHGALLLGVLKEGNH